MGQRLCDLAQDAFDAFWVLSIAGVATLAARTPPCERHVSTWTLCGGRLAPRRANERYTSEPPTLARLVCQAYHRHPGRTTRRPPHGLNSLTPDAHRAGPLHPRLPRFATFHYRPRCAHLRVASFRFCRSYRVPATLFHAITA